MRLRYVANVRLPTEKAHGIQIMSMCAAFAQVGADVELVVPARWNRIDADPFEYYGIPRTFALRRLRTFDLTRFERIFGKYAFLLQSWSFSRVALRDAVRDPADVYFHRDEIAFKRFAEAGLPSVWELHTVPRHLGRYSEAIGKCRSLVAITRGIADSLVVAGVPREKIIVASDGVDMEKFGALPDCEVSRAKLGFAPGEIVILYTGQLYPWKGVDTLVEAAAGLPEGIVVAIVGGGAGRLEELKAKAEASGARCRFFGQVRHEEVSAFLAAADIVAIPNSGKEEISRSHTSPLKLFEAMAAGKAIIASDLPSLREVLGERSAVFFDADDPAAMRERIVSLASDGERRREMGAVARKASAGYSWVARAEKIVAVLGGTDR